MSATDYLTPEAEARVDIDRMLEAAGWAVQGTRRQASIWAPRRASRFASSSSSLERRTAARADYLLFVDRQVVGVLEAKSGRHGARERRAAARLERTPKGSTPDLPTPIEPIPFTLHLDRDRDAVQERPRSGRAHAQRLRLPPSRDAGGLGRRVLRDPARPVAPPPAPEAAAARPGRPHARRRSGRSATSRNRSPSTGRAR